MNYKATCPVCETELELSVAVGDGDWSDLEIWLKKLQQHLQSQLDAPVGFDIALVPDGRFAVVIIPQGMNRQSAVGTQELGETIDEAIGKCLEIIVKERPF